MLTSAQSKINTQNNFVASSDVKFKLNNNWCTLSFTFVQNLIIEKAFVLKYYDFGGGIFL